MNMDGEDTSSDSALINILNSQDWSASELIALIAVASTFCSPDVADVVDVDWALAPGEEGRGEDDLESILKSGGQTDS